MEKSEGAHPDMTEKDSFVCIHGHFYQPPRENPWLDAVPCEPSAAPYHDWNRRITRECYGPNAVARIPGREGGILSLVDNYEYMSFNFGPTLLTWLLRHDPGVYRRILDADRKSIDRYHGHGNAIAQVYNHIIMPLASTRDKRTQIIWGMRDFEHRFGRRPEGMWLAETAVDSETLTLMAGEGIRFTILSPDQAEAVRPLGSKTRRVWKEIDSGSLDTTKPYRVFPTGGGDRFIDVFFYNGAVSRGVAYEGLLASGEHYLSNIRDAANNGRRGPRLITVATDGESYGHHSKFGDMALAWLFKTLEKTTEMSVINPGAFLERCPPAWEAKIREASSWSCSHGVERWRADCGCNVTGTPGWNQAWRAPLRHGLERLSA
ncbi:MAG TPA: glycoside hydrolase, partial [Desulfobacteraceae bacterium]|nr:glycoside hydrolase [Desulfobacteraceae bacterium]